MVVVGGAVVVVGGSVVGGAVVGGTVVVGGNVVGGAVVVVGGAVVVTGGAVVGGAVVGGAVVGGAVVGGTVVVVGGGGGVAPAAHAGTARKSCVAPYCSSRRSVTSTTVGAVSWSRTTAPSQSGPMLASTSSGFVSSQSQPARSQSTWVRPISAAVAATSELVAPYGGRKQTGVSPVWVLMMFCAPVSSPITPVVVRSDNRGWVTVWLPRAWPAAAICWVVPGSLTTAAPSTKKVAVAPCACSAASTPAVRPFWSGPSSYVR